MCPRAGLYGCGKSRSPRDLISGRSNPYNLLRYILLKKFEQVQFFLFSYDGLSPPAPSLYTMTHIAKNAFLFFVEIISIMSTFQYI